MIDIKRFKNGNMHISGIEEEETRESFLVQVLYSLYDNDCTIASEEFCLSNFDMGVLIYSYYFDRCYILNYTDVERLKNKEINKIILYACNVKRFFDSREELEQALEK